MVSAMVIVLDECLNIGLKRAWQIVIFQQDGTEDFWLIFTLLGVTMSQKSSVIQIANLVP
jgi:hypothetical protein